MKEHRMGTGTRAGAETRAVAGMGTGTRMGIEMGRRTGSGGAEKRRRSAKREKPRKNCIHDQTLLSRTRHLGKQGEHLRAPDGSVFKAWCLYTRIELRGEPGLRDGIDRTGSGAGSESGAAMEMGTGTAKRVEANDRAHDGNRDGSGDGTGRGGKGDGDRG